MIPATAVEAAAVVAISNIASHHIDALSRMEDMLARAAVHSVPAERVRGIVAAERARAETSYAPFSWVTVRDKVDSEAPAASGKDHWMSAMPFLHGARYITCEVPGCGRVKRNDLVWPAMKPLIHNGGKARRG